MLTTFLAAGTAAAGQQNNYGLGSMLQQGGIISWAVFIILVLMLVVSLYILFTKLFEQQKVRGEAKRVQASFWQAANIREGAAKLDKNGAYRQLVDDGLAAQDQFAKLTDPVEAHDWLHGSLARSEATVNSKLSGGLSFLATVGATAPFVGLLGTVIGIYRALINIGLAGSASLDKVAGPVGEALIMTALGLLVAVPAVLAYNWLQSRNKRIAELLSGFSTDVLANINSGGAVRPAVLTQASTQQAGKAAATAPARPAGTTTTTTTAPRP